MKLRKTKYGQEFQSWSVVQQLDIALEKTAVVIRCLVGLLPVARTDSWKAKQDATTTTKPEHKILYSTCFHACVHLMLLTDRFLSQLHWHGFSLFSKTVETNLWH